MSENDVPQEERWPLPPQLQSEERIPRVPPSFKDKKKHSLSKVYEPILVSLGPYHHGKQELCHGEAFKKVALEALIKSASKDIRALFLDIMDGEIDNIRGCYDAQAIAQYDNQSLAEMMLHDACFILLNMDVRLGDENAAVLTMDHFGVCGFSFINQDLILLENQIPLRIVKHLFTIINGDEIGWRERLGQFTSFITFGYANYDAISERLVWEEEEEPFHLLEIVRLMQFPMKDMEKPRCLTVRYSLLKGRHTDDLIIDDSQEIKDFERVNYRYRSVTDLKTKGIHIKPSKVSSPVTFTSYPLYGELELLPWYVTYFSLALFSNIVVYELASFTRYDLAMTARITFMKSLIETTEDVKELREKGVLFNNLGGDDEVVRLFKEVDTFGLDNVDIYLNLKASIGKHCSSKRKTWLAEFANTYFRNPWTVIALLAAVFLLCLNFIQTTFTVHPPS